MRILLRALAATAVVLVSGCSFQAAYNSAYVSFDATPKEKRLPGKVVVVTAAQDDQALYTGNPTSFTGGGSTLTLPLGQIVREIAMSVFGDLFAEGAAHAQAADAAAQDAITVSPRVTSFQYEYNQLKNAGFAITPGVMVALSIQARAGQDELPRRQYATQDYFEGESYMVSGQPGEQISKTLHRALVDLMRKAAADLRMSLDGSAARAPWFGGPVRLEDLPLPGR